MPYNRTETLQRKLNACKSRNSRKPDPAIAIGKGADAWQEFIALYEPLIIRFARRSWMPQAG